MSYHAGIRTRVATDTYRQNFDEIFRQHQVAEASKKKLNSVSMSFDDDKTPEEKQLLEKAIDGTLARQCKIMKR